MNNDKIKPALVDLEGKLQPKAQNSFNYGANALPNHYQGRTPTGRLPVDWFLFNSCSLGEHAVCGGTISRFGHADEIICRCTCKCHKHDDEAARPWGLVGPDGRVILSD